MDRRTFLKLFAVIAASTHGMVAKSNDYSEIDNGDPIEDILPQQSQEGDHYLLSVHVASNYLGIGYLYDENGTLLCMPTQPGSCMVWTMRDQLMRPKKTNGRLILRSEVPIVGVACLAKCSTLHEPIDRVDQQIILTSQPMLDNPIWVRAQHI